MDTDRPGVQSIPESNEGLILSLAEKLYICSRLLTAAAQRQKWDTAEVQTLMEELRASIKENCRSNAAETVLEV